MGGLRALPIVISFLVSLFTSGVVLAQTQEQDARKEQARVAFDRGVSLLEQKAWDAALVEFMASRRLFPARGNTLNAAVCLRNLGRSDEALEMFEALLREFPNLSDEDRTRVRRDVEDLERVVGQLGLEVSEVGAVVLIDALERGVTPLPPLRLKAGTHALRIYKTGFIPIERRVEIVGGRPLSLRLTLESLAQSGRLAVREESGRVAEVIVDGIVLGKTPWQGLLAPGEHSVLLRSDDDWGTPPASAVVRLNQVTSLTVAVERLDCSVRIVPTPLNSTLAIDGISVGNGVWDGRLRAGRHRVEVAQDGFIPQARWISLAKGPNAVVTVALERDPNSPRWAVSHPSRFGLELVAGGLTSPLLGGSIRNDCSGNCSSDLPLGGWGTVHGTYEMPSGLGFSIDAGYLLVRQQITNRPTTVFPVGRGGVAGTATDTLVLRGITAGAAASFHRGERFTWMLRLGAGVLLATASDERSDALAQTGPSSSSPISLARETPSATYAYLAPEARAGIRFGEHVEASAGLRVAVLAALEQPRWSNGQQMSTAADFVTYPNDTLFGEVVVLTSPFLSLRYEF